MKEITKEMIDDLDKEVPKHRKKTDSEKSKSKNKSKHKHKYVDCLFVWKFKGIGNLKGNLMPYKGTYCVHCGKIGDVRGIFVDIDGVSARQVNDVGEAKAMFPELEVFEISNFFQQYVPISKVESN